MNDLYDPFSCFVDSKEPHPSVTWEHDAIVEWYNKHEVDSCGNLVIDNAGLQQQVEGHKLIGLISEYSNRDIVSYGLYPNIFAKENCYVTYTLSYADGRIDPYQCDSKWHSISNKGDFYFLVNTYLESTSMIVDIYVQCPYTQYETVFSINILSDIEED